MKKFSNRYGDTYHWEHVADRTYVFRMTGDSLNWCRFGARENSATVDAANLGFFDPAGGPYIAVGDTVPAVSSETSYDVIASIWTESGQIFVSIE
jgi:hypothetical protein